MRLLIRKGETPNPDWSNLWEWTQRQADQTDKFEEWKGDVPELPKLRFHDQEVVVKPPSADIRKMLVVETIKKMDATMFTDGGYPKVTELKKILGFEVDKELRDAAFAIYKAEMEAKK